MLMNTVNKSNKKVLTNIEAHSHLSTAALKVLLWILFLSVTLVLQLPITFYLLTFLPSLPFYLPLVQLGPEGLYF